MQVVFVKDVAKVVGLDAKEVDDLAKCGIDLFLRHIDTLSATQAEPADRRDLIHCVHGENLVDKRRLLQPSQ